jgi:hypothetical protein
MTALAACDARVDKEKNYDRKLDYSKLKFIFSEEKRRDGEKHEHDKVHFHARL